MRPLSFVPILYSEVSRFAYLPDNPTDLWKKLLWPILGAFEAFVVAGLPTTVVVDHQLSASLADSTPFLLTPSKSHLSKQTVAALAAYQKAGGVTIQIPTGEWQIPSQRYELFKQVYTAVSVAGAPFASVRRQDNSTGQYHSVFHISPHGNLVVMITNNFTVIISLMMHITFTLKITTSQFAELCGRITG